MLDLVAERILYAWEMGASSSEWQVNGYTTLCIGLAQVQADSREVRDCVVLLWCMSASDPQSSVLNRHRLLEGLSANQYWDGG